MNKASRILYILGAVFGFITAAVFFIVGIVYMVFSVKMKAPTNLDGLQAYNEWIKTVANFSGKDASVLLLDGLSGGTAGELDAALKANMTKGITFFILGILLIAGGVVALVAKGFPGRNLPIHIVATILNFDSLAMIGGILGIVSAALAMARGNKKEEPAEKPAE